jgi:hypothetical protein
MALSLSVAKWGIVMEGEQVRIWIEFIAACCNYLSRISPRGTWGRTPRNPRWKIIQFLAISVVQKYMIPLQNTALPQFNNYCSCKIILRSFFSINVWSVFIDGSIWSLSADFHNFFSEI